MPLWQPGAASVDDFSKLYPKVLPLYSSLVFASHLFTNTVFSPANSKSILKSFIPSSFLTHRISLRRALRSVTKSTWDQSNSNSGFVSERLLTAATSGTRGALGMRYPFWSTKKMPTSGWTLYGAVRLSHCRGAPWQTLHQSTEEHNKQQEKYIPGTITVGLSHAVQLYDPIYSMLVILTSSSVGSARFLCKVVTGVGCRPSNMSRSGGNTSVVPGSSLGT